MEAHTSTCVKLVVGTLKAILKSFGGGPFLSQTGCHPSNNENLKIGILFRKQLDLPSRFKLPSTKE